MPSDDQKLEELRELVQGIRDRVRTRYPETSAAVGEAISVPLADLMPVVHARDAAQGKAAAIGAVNPRRGGLANNAIQFTKRTVSRGLNWFVRDQVVFNQSVITCVETLMEAVNDLNRSLVSLGIQIGERMEQDRHAAEPALAELHSRANQITADAHSLRQQVAPLPAKWDLQVRDTQIRLDALTAVTERRALAAETHEREVLQAQHRDFSHALDLNGQKIQQQLWQDLERIRLEFERIIHFELRTVRQRGIVASSAPVPAPELPMDYPAFATRFRGLAEHVRAGQQFYVERFRGAREVIDLGCGNGEFLEVMREAGISARGIDASAESIAACNARFLNAEQHDIFTWLADQPDHSLAGIFCAQVVEHLPPARVPELVQLCAGKLERNALLVFETPNPECLAIFATHFYLDPTHTRPVPYPLLAFYLEESGMGAIEVVKRFPAADSWPELNQLPSEVRDRFFGGLDYAIFARKL